MLVPARHPLRRPFAVIKLIFMLTRCCRGKTFYVQIYVSCVCAVIALTMSWRGKLRDSKHISASHKACLMESPKDSLQTTRTHPAKAFLRIQHRRTQAKVTRRAQLQVILSVLLMSFLKLFLKARDQSTPNAPKCPRIILTTVRASTMKRSTRLARR